MIRTYEPKDIENVLRLLRLNTPRYFAPAEEADLEQYLKNNSQNYFVVEKNEQIIGAGGINFFEELSLARISWDIIHPAYHKQGIGNELTRFRIDQIKKKPQIKQIQVRTTQMAYKFYEKFGFGIENKEKDYWAQGFDLYDMRMISSS